MAGNGRQNYSQDEPVFDVNTIADLASRIVAMEKEVATLKTQAADAVDLLRSRETDLSNLRIKFTEAVMPRLDGSTLDRRSRSVVDIAKLEALLRESKREHYHCDDSWYCCGKCRHPDHVLLDPEDYLDSHGGEAARVGGVCNCGADAWNKRVDDLLNDKD